MHVEIEDIKLSKDGDRKAKQITVPHEVGPVAAAK